MLTWSRINEERNSCREIEEFVLTFYFLDFTNICTGQTFITAMQQFDEPGQVFNDYMLG